MMTTFYLIFTSAIFYAVFVAWWRATQDKWPSRATNLTLAHLVAIVLHLGITIDNIQADIPILAALSLFCATVLTAILARAAWRAIHGQQAFPINDATE